MKISLIVATVTIIVLTLIPAIFDGQRRFRWGPDTKTIELIKRMNDFPKQIGAWESMGDDNLNDNSVDQLQPLATINRVYHNASEQKYVQVFILLGPTGPTAAHTPDICFDSREYRKLGVRRNVAVNPEFRPDSNCFITEFESRDAKSEYLKSWYAWTVDGTWAAPEKPRFHFAKSRQLFKIQIVASYRERSELENDKVVDQFVADIEQTLRHQVF